MKHHKLSWMFFFAVIFASIAPRQSVASMMESVQLSLYAGKTARAEAIAGTRLAEAPDDAQARFALGAVQFLRAAERLAQNLHRYGLRSDYTDPTGLSRLPFLRIPVPPNSSPDKVTYAALRSVLQEFVTDLSRGEATLAEIPETDVDLPLNLGLIRLDLDADGVSSEGETLWEIFRGVADFRWLNSGEAILLKADFDASDIPWLRGYCHLLMAMGEFLLAHDWHEAYEATFHSVFPQADLPLSAALGPVDQEPDFQSGVADLIAFAHLSHWPVAAPERMPSILAHLEKMVALSRENWRRILAETDARNEWIPSPKQQGVLPRMNVTDERVAGWQLFLDEFEALLQGKKLLPHFRFEKGINLRRIFTEPRSFDIILMIQGSAALPYLEEGELTHASTWMQMTRLLGGDFFRYFIWFN